jgi:hypothetical protein
MPDLALDLAEAFKEEGFTFSKRWHTFGKTCQNGCHTVKDKKGNWSHVPTLPELIEFIDGSDQLNAFTRLFARRALRKLRKLPPEPVPDFVRRRRRRPHGEFKAAEIIPFPQKRGNT